MLLRPSSPGFLFWLGLAAATLLFPIDQPASAQDNAQREIETLVLPFEPPLSQPFKYEVEIERIRSKGNSSYLLEQSLVFERVDGGLILRLSTTAFESREGRLNLTDPKAIAQIPIPLRPFLLPMTVELDSAGEMVRMRNWPEMQRELQALPELVVDLTDPKEEREEALQIARNIMGGFAALTAEEAPAAMIRAWPQILGYGGLELENAETYVTETEYDLGAFDAIVSADLEISLTRTDDGNLLLQETTRPQSDQFIAAVRKSFLKLFEGLDSEKLEAAKAELAKAQEIQMEDSLEIAFDASSGHPISAKISRETRGSDGQSSGETTTIRLIK